MSETQSDPIDVSKFKNGDDVHFDYNSTTNDQIINSSNVQKKKKKKKSKNKHKGSSNVEVTLNDPDVEYPTSRVIKQAPNGDVIIESLDEPSDTHAKSVTANIWDNATLEEQENLKSFWESLDEAQKIELVKIDKKSVMDIFKNESKSANTLNNHQNNNNPQGSLTGPNGGALNGSNTNANMTGASSNSSNGACTCSYCGRKNNFIEDELENIYDNHFDDIIDFIHEVRDINDLNALPGLLFGGFHMLEEEHKLQKRQQKYKSRQERDVHHHHNHESDHICSDTLNSDYDGSTEDRQHRCEHEIEHAFQEDEHEDECGHNNAHSHIHSHSHDHTGNHNGKHSHSHSHNHESNHNHSHSHFHYDQIEELNNEDELSQEAVLQKSLDDELNKELASKSNNNDLSLATKEQRVFHKLLDPKLFEALENLDFDKMKDTPANNNLAHILEKAGSLRDIIRDLHKADKVELEKGMAFLQNMGKIFSSDMNNTMNHDLLNEQISNGLSSFAEDLLKNDGNSFIDMMESLSESRTAREDLLKEKFDKDSTAAWIDEDDHTKSGTDISIPKPDLHQVQELEGELNDEYDEEDDYDEEEEDDGEEDEEDEEEEALDDEEFEEDEEEDASDTESEISEEEKMQEIRRLFLIQVIKLFQERLKNAYKEKLSQDRTRKLIEELEAEENAKKEREMKKLKQKEKAKEKKRLQQLAKEEERRKKEEEQKAKEEELKQKQEALRAEQRRKKEEAKQKREEEKRKRIEELKRKELEQQKRLEAQRKKEDETKKLKDEKKKKAEEERKKKEEEKRKKESQKKLDEEERSKLLGQQKETENSEDINQLSRDLENARLSQNFNIPSPVVQETIPAQPHESRVKSPTKNHILDQLYLAKPRSLSNSTNTTPQINNVTPGYIPDLSSNGMLPSVLSPSGRNTILNNGNMSNQSVPSPWSSQAFNANTQVPPVYQPQLSSNAFSPFNSSLNQNSLSSNANENLHTNPLNTSNFNEPFATSTQPSSVWNPGATSRNNSIWSNSPNIASNSTLWGNSVPSPSVGAVGVGGNPNNLDGDLIQGAAYQAFQFLQNSNQLEFGVAPSLKLFQTTKTILSNQGLTLNQFLTSCRNTGSLSGYRFDFIYDDFGTVTHIKASSTNITLQPSQNNPNTQSINSIGLGNAAVNDNESSLLNTLNDINNPNSFSNGVRGLWN